MGFKGLQPLLKRGLKAYNLFLKAIERRTALFQRGIKAYNLFFERGFKGLQLFFKGDLKAYNFKKWT